MMTLAQLDKLADIRKRYAVRTVEHDPTKGTNIWGTISWGGREWEYIIQPDGSAMRTPANSPDDYIDL
jgi:hypothetical protein